MPWQVSDYIGILLKFLQNITLTEAAFEDVLKISFIIRFVNTRYEVCYGICALFIQMLYEEVVKQISWYCV